MNVTPDFNTKQELKRAIKEGRKVRVYNNLGEYGPTAPTDGEVLIEGPVNVNSWFGEGVLKDGLLVEVK